MKGASAVAKDGMQPSPSPGAVGQVERGQGGRRPGAFRQVVGEGPRRKEEARCIQAGGRRGAKEEGGGQVHSGRW